MTATHLSREDVFLQALSERGFENPESLLESVSWVSVKRGEYLFRQGDSGDSLYVVIRGRIRILVNSPETGGDIELASYSKGDIVGELALLADQPRAASVQALRTTELAQLSRSEAERLFSNPGFMLPLGRLIALRAARNEGKRERPLVYCLFNFAEQPGMDAGGQLIGAMENIADTLKLEFDDVPKTFVSDGAINWSGVRGWLNDREQSTRVLVLISRAGESEWNREIVEHADGLIWLVKPDMQPDSLHETRSMLQQWVNLALVQETLLLLHDRKQPDYPALRKWYRVAPISDIRHVFDASDISSISRRLVGKGVALILGGGGARAMAHIGVIRALNETGVSIDQIGGTSVGSVIAAQYAAGYSVEEMLEINSQFWHRLSKQLTLPVVSVWSDHLLNQMLESFFKDLHFEDLRLDSFACVTNLDECQSQYKDRGLVRQWTRASMSLPAMWPPVLDEAGHLYVDGGVLDNLPVAGVRQGSVSTVVVSNVSQPTESASYRGGNIPSGGVEAITSKLRGQANYPGLGAVIYKTAVVGSLNQFVWATENADLLIQPELTDFGINDYPKLRQIAEQGYTAAMQQLEGFTVN